MATGLYLGAVHLTNKAGGVEVFAEGTDFGNPEPEVTVIQSLLQDGDLVEYTRDGNRTQSLRIVLTGTVAARQANEVALLAELHKRNTLTVPPLEVGGFAIVFDVVDSSLNQIGDDLAEVRSGEWHYSIQVTSLPFGHSVNEVTVPALAATGSTTTLVNDGSATTNWTGQVNGGASTPSVVSGAVRVTNASAVTGVVTVSNIYTAAITTSSTKYLVVDWKPESPGGYPTLRAYGDGTELALVMQVVSPTAGFTRSTFYVAAASIAVLRLDSRTDVKSTDPALVRSLYVDNINRTDVKPSLGTGRQLIRAIAVSGSARTQAAVTVSHASTALGDVLAYIYDGAAALAYSPPLRQYRVSGPSVTTDTAMVSGFREDMKNATLSVFEIPVQNLVAGAHVLVARVSGVSADPVNWTMGTYVNGTLVGSTISGAATLSVLGGVYDNLVITRQILPTTDVDEAASNAFVRVTLNSSLAAANAVNLDEAWLLNTTIGQIAMVSCGTGTAASGGPARRLYIEPPTVTRPRPTVRIGHATDRSDAFYPGNTSVEAWDVPEFEPPSVNVLTVTSNVADASVEARFYPRWHTHAGS